jgi:hypothetical protein
MLNYTQELYFLLSQNSSLGTEKIQEVTSSPATELRPSRYEALLTTQLLCSVYVTFHAGPQKSDSNRMINRTYNGFMLKNVCPPREFNLMEFSEYRRDE